MEKPIPVGRLCLRLTDPQISLKKILLSQLNPKLHVLFFVSTFALDTKRFPQWTYFPLSPCSMQPPGFLPQGFIAVERLIPILL